MNVLIIGSKGFIGSHVLDYFSKQTGYDCYGCDVVVDYTAKNYFLLDASNSDFNDVFESSDFNVCINCSGAASVPDSFVHPLRDFTLNVLNVVKLLEAIRRHAPSCRFINLSSASVYGNPKKLPVAESDTVSPISPYGLHKLQAEQVCKEYHHYWGLRTCCLRIFSAYGPGLKKQLFWDLYQKSLQADRVDLYGTGNESRDFIFIDDIVQAVQLVINKAQFTGESINIANGEEVSISAAAHSFYKALGWKGTVHFLGNNREGDPLNWQADIEQLKSLGYTACFNMEAGVNAYATWLKERA
jgi:UDP-glucose 4-epimerase